MPALNSVSSPDYNSMQSNRWKKARRGYHESVDTDSSPPRWPLTAPWPPTGSGACPPPSTPAPHSTYPTTGGPLHHYHLQQQQQQASFHPRPSDTEVLHPHYPSPTASRSSQQPQYRLPRAPQPILPTVRGEVLNRGGGGGEYLYRLPHNTILSNSPPHHSSSSLMMAELIGGGRSGGDGGDGVGGGQDPLPTEGEEAPHDTKDGPQAGRGKLERLCGVCGDRALGYNFNAITCESCKAFFRRNALKNKNLKCPFQDNCAVDTVTRRFCQKCRLTKCFDIGMKKEWIMTDEEKQKKKQKIEANKIRKFGGGNSDQHGRSRSVDSSEDSMSFTMSPGMRKGALSPVESPRCSSRQGEADLAPGTDGKGQPYFLPPCSPTVSGASGVSDQACQKLKDQQLLKEEYMKTTPVPSVLPLQGSVGKTLHHDSGGSSTNGSLKPQAIVRGMVRDPESSAPKVQRLLNQTDVHNTSTNNLNLASSFLSSATTSSSSLSDLVSPMSPHNFLPPNLESSISLPEHCDNPPDTGLDVSGVMANRSGDSVVPSLMSMAVASVAPQPLGLLSTIATQGSLQQNHSITASTNSSLVLDSPLETNVSSSNTAERLVSHEHSRDVANALSNVRHSNCSVSITTPSNNTPPADLFTLAASVCSTTVAPSSSSSNSMDSRISLTTALMQVTGRKDSSHPGDECVVESVLASSDGVLPETSSDMENIAHSTSTFPPNCSTYLGSAPSGTDSYEDFVELNGSSNIDQNQTGDKRNLYHMTNEDSLGSGSGQRVISDTDGLCTTELSLQTGQEQLTAQQQQSQDSRQPGTESSTSLEDSIEKHFAPSWHATLPQSKAQQQTPANEATPLTGDHLASKHSIPTDENYIKQEPGETGGEQISQNTCSSALLQSRDGVGTDDDWSDFRVLTALNSIQGGQAGDGDPSNVMDSIVNTAVQAEYSPVSLHVGAASEQEQQPPRRKGCGPPLTPMEQRKLDELHTANAAMMAPLSEDQAYKNQHNPSLINVINMTDIAIRRLIQMSKQLDSFSYLCTEDQIALLKGSCTEMMILRSVSAYDADKDSWKIPEHHDTYKSIKLKVLKAAPGNVHVYEEHKRFILAFKPEWRHDQNIMLLLSAITLFTPSRPNVRHPKAIEHEQCCYLLLLKRYLESALGGCEGRTVYAGLLERINDLRRLNENHLKVYMQVNPEEVRPLLIEIFDLQQR